MRIEFLLVMAIVILMVADAMGQTLAPPSEQALGTRLMREISTGLQCDAELITLKAELEKVKAELSKLKAPPEKK